VQTYKVHLFLSESGLELPFSFTTGCCPLIVPLLSRPFMQTWRWCFGQKTSWASDILRAFERLRGCDTYTQALLQGLPICYSDFTADLRFRMRIVWRDIADLSPLESDNKLVIHHSWFAAPS